jgi:hypothetical protein
MPIQHAHINQAGEQIIIFFSCFQLKMKKGQMTAHVRLLIYFVLCFVTSVILISAGYILLEVIRDRPIKISLLEDQSEPNALFVACK